MVPAGWRGFRFGWHVWVACRLREDRAIVEWWVGGGAEPDSGIGVVSDSSAPRRSDCGRRVRV